MITRQDIDKLAALSRLTLSDAEANRMMGEIGSILAYVDVLKKATGNDTGPTMSVNKNIMRADEKAHESGLYTDKILAAAPRSEGK